MSRGKEVNLKVKWNTHKVFVGDICYALDDDLYQRVWVTNSISRMAKLRTMQLLLALNTVMAAMKATKHRMVLMPVLLV